MMMFVERIRGDGFVFHFHKETDSCGCQIDSVLMAGNLKPAPAPPNPAKAET